MVVHTLQITDGELAAINNCAFVRPVNDTTIDICIGLVLQAYAP